MFLAAQKVGNMLNSYYQCENFNYTIQDGADAGQTVPHVHIHILPGMDQKIHEAETYGKARTIEDMSEEAQNYRSVLESIQDPTKIAPAL